MTGFLIRDSNDGDMVEVQAIYAHHVQHGLGSFEEEAPGVEEMRRRRADVLGRGLPYLVAASEGEVLGYAYATPWRPRAAYRFSVENSVYIGDGQQRRGIGRALLAALIDRCEVGNWRQMVAVIGDSDNAGSIGLHTAAGFRPIGTLKAVGFKFGRWVDVVLMQRDLGPGGRTLPNDG